LLAGWRGDSPDYDGALARFNTDGSLDTSFGSGGKLLPALGGGLSRLWRIKVLSNGKILAAGWSSLIPYPVLIRLNPNGSMDYSFNGGGIVGLASIAALSIQADGKIVIVGLRYEPSTGYSAIVVRLTPDGRPDRRFGIFGWASLGSEYGYPSAMILQPDGKIVVLGAIEHLGGGVDTVIFRLIEGGDLDQTFGVDGKIVSDLSPGFEPMYAISLQTDGKILVGGGSGAPLRHSTLVRYHSNGFLDRTFGDGGKSVISTSYWDDIRSIVVQPDGKILAGGNSALEYGREVTVLRFLSDGRLDTEGFGRNGLVRLASRGNSEVGPNLVLQNDGRIVISTNTGSLFSLTRLQGSD
jgi:uncharacterized delta-60 repeat protein